MIALIIGLGIGNLYWAVTDWSQSDAAAYWQAGLRLRDGAPLYPVFADADASNIYRYAPWFAFAAIPFTFLPVEAAGALWSLVLVAASTAAVLPLARRRAWVLVAFFFPILIGISAVGNVQALMVAWLLWGVDRRSGPLWIALAASLKAVPVLLALVYVGRRQWVRAGMTMALSALLVAPAFLYDLSGYVTTSGQAGTLVQLPILYGAAVAAACALTLVAPRRLGWLVGATSVALATPRLFVYDVTYLLVGTSPRGSSVVEDVNRPAVDHIQKVVVHADEDAQWVE